MNCGELVENYLMSGLSDLNIKYEILDGEGAFYGPKVEFSFKRFIKKENGNVELFQLDFILMKEWMLIILILKDIEKHQLYYIELF